MSSKFEQLLTNEFGDPPNSNAEEQIRDAKAIMKGSGCCWFDPTLGSDAARCYDHAAIQYKHAKQFPTALKYHLKAVDYSTRAKNQSDVVTYLQNAARTMMECSDKNESVKLFNKAGKAALEKGDGKLSGKLFGEGAGVAEKEGLRDYKQYKYMMERSSPKSIDILSEDQYKSEKRLWCKQAIELYEKAFTLLMENNNPVMARSYELKLAEMKASLGDYIGAVTVFERNVKAQLDNSGFRFMAKIVLTNSLLCYLNMYAAWDGQEREKQDEIAYSVQSFSSQANGSDSMRESIANLYLDSDKVINTRAYMKAEEWKKGNRKNM